MLSFAPRLDLPPNARRTFRFHLAYALLDAICGGILLNAPVIALQEIRSANWQLPLRDGCAGLGMLASLYLASWMAPRRKMPFVFVPGMIAGVSAAAMAGALLLDSPFWFLLLFGIGGMFEVVTRPAITSILRENYPVATRGHVTATVRQWSSLAFMASIMLSAYVLRAANDNAKFAAAIEILCAAGIGMAAFLCFRKIPTPDAATPPDDSQLELWKNLRHEVSVVASDGRYRRYLLGCFLEGFFVMLYLPLAPALLSKTLHFDYVWCALLLHGIPTLAAFVTTGTLGQWLDRANPWVSWAWVRFAFALDALLLAVTPLAAFYVSPLAVVLPVAGRLLRGSVQGGWWVLLWQIGVTHFAPPGQETSRYMGIMVFLNGLTRMAASLAGGILSAYSVQPETLILLGGLGVFVSGIFSLAQAFRERKERRPRTFAEFEGQFEKETFDPAIGREDTAGKPVG